MANPAPMAMIVMAMAVARAPPSPAMMIQAPVVPTAVAMALRVAL
jgi:hypothetical protein